MLCPIDDKLCLAFFCERWGCRKETNSMSDGMTDRRSQPDGLLVDGTHVRGTKPDVVNHPPHYTAHPSGIEAIEVTRHMCFNLGNVIKYVWRADLKNGIEDLRKAAWYLDDEIKRREKFAAAATDRARGR